ncbi:exported hypothetical protein [Streptomyces misionensis JCM 4497]
MTRRPRNRRRTPRRRSAPRRRRPGRPPRRRHRDRPYAARRPVFSSPQPLFLHARPGSPAAPRLPNDGTHPKVPIAAGDAPGRFVARLRQWDRLSRAGSGTPRRGRTPTAARRARVHRVRPAHGVRACP